MLPVPNSSTGRSAFDPYLSSSSSSGVRPCGETEDEEECESDDDSFDHISSDVTDNSRRIIQVPKIIPPKVSGNAGQLVNARRNQPTHERPLAATTTVLSSADDDTGDHRTIISAGKLVTPPSNTRLKVTSSAAAAADSSRNSIGSSKNTAQESQALSTWAIIGIAAAVLVVAMVAAFVVYRYRSRDEGSYKVDESRNYGYEVCSSKPMEYLNGKARSSGRHRRKDVEWYV